MNIDLGTFFAAVTPLGLLAQTAAVIWWAAKLSANQSTLTDAVKELKVDVKEHIDSDQRFQLTITEKLSTVVRNGNGNGNNRNGGHP